LQKFAAYLMDGRENQIKAIKNLPVDAYKNGVELLSRHLGISITSAFQDPIDFVAVNWSDTVISWNKADAAWWRDTLAAELSKAGQLLSPQAAENSWKILGHSREAAIAFFPWIAATRSAEKALLMCPPAEFSPTIAEALAPATKDRRWFGLHAFLVLHYRDAPAAALEQLGWETENPDSAFAGTQRIAKSLSDEVMRYLLKTSGHSVFVEEYAARTMAKPDLLSFLEIRLPVWRLVWLESIQRTGNLQHGIADVKSTVSQVLQLLAAEEDVPVKLLEFIADSEFADLTDLPHRSGIWANLASAVRPKFLKATTGTIVRQLIEGQIAGDNLELPIREYYSSREFLSVFLRNPLGRIDSVITLYENIVGAGESQDRLLVEYIRAYRGSLNNAVSAKFGKVLEKHGLSKAALEVFHRAKSEADFRPALIGARSVLNLGLWERFRYGYLLGEQQSAESVRQVWLDLAIRLYPLGPDQNHIWERAGGNPAKLGSAGSREDHWRDAFRLLRDGGGGKDISHWQLMKEMKKDFPENDELKEIQKYLSK
jgi:hypothetical protein